MSFSSLTTVLDNNLPTFRLDALVILMKHTTLGILNLEDLVSLVVIHNCAQTKELHDLMFLILHVTVG